MENTENIQEQTTATEQEARTFTQDDVNKIINKKYAEWASRTADYDELKEKASKFDEIEEANKSELQKVTERANNLQKKLDELTRANEVNLTRSKVAEELKIPAHLLTSDTEDGCREQAAAILAFANGTAPTKVVDNGEFIKGGSKTTRDLFAEIINNELGK